MSRAQGLAKEVEAAILKQLRTSWEIKSLQGLKGQLTITLATPRRVTTEQYSAMMNVVCYELVTKNASNAYKTVKITNLSGGSGYVYEEAPGCKEAMASRNAKFVILGKTHGLLPSERPSR